MIVPELIPRPINFQMIFVMPSFIGQILSLNLLCLVTVYKILSLRHKKGSSDSIMQKFGNFAAAK